MNSCPRCGKTCRHGGSLSSHVRWCGKTEERFWEKVDQSGGAASCWNWTALRDRFGYGLFAEARPSRKVVLAHRLAWKLKNSDAGALHVLHRCDNPACCNPAHLFLGTHQDNMDDMWAKGRHRIQGLNGVRRKQQAPS